MWIASGQASRAVVIVDAAPRQLDGGLSALAQELLVALGAQVPELFHVLLLLPLLDVLQGTGQELVGK